MFGACLGVYGARLGVSGAVWMCLRRLWVCLGTLVAYAAREVCPTFNCCPDPEFFKREICNVFFREFNLSTRLRRFLMRRKYPKLTKHTSHQKYIARVERNSELITVLRFCKRHIVHVTICQTCTVCDRGRDWPRKRMSIVADRDGEP